MNKETSYSSSYPENDKSFLKLPKNEISRSINKHMKEIVPENVLKKYIEKKANNYDEYISFRKIFAYQYGAIMALNYILAVDANLYHYIIDLRSRLYIDKLEPEGIFEPCSTASVLNRIILASSQKHFSCVYEELLQGKVLC